MYSERASSSLCGNITALVWFVRVVAVIAVTAPPLPPPLTIPVPVSVSVSLPAQCCYNPQTQQYHEQPPSRSQPQQTNEREQCPPVVVAASVASIVVAPAPTVLTSCQAPSMERHRRHTSPPPRRSSCARTRVKHTQKNQYLLLQPGDGPRLRLGRAYSCLKEARATVLVSRRRQTQHEGPPHQHTRH